jgi:hypothetical protein
VNERTSQLPSSKVCAGNRDPSGTAEIGHYYQSPKPASKENPVRRLAGSLSLGRSGRRRYERHSGTIADSAQERLKNFELSKGVKWIAAVKLPPA